MTDSASPTVPTPRAERKPVDTIAGLSRSLPPVRGKRRLGLALMRRAEARNGLDGVWSGRLGDGTRLELPRKSLMTWSVAFEGTYDGVLFGHVEQFIRPASLVLDVGASLGLWTVQLGRVAKARGASVWAFEPNPANIAWIERNADLNGLADTVTVRALGLGDRAESSSLISAEYGVGNGAIAIDGMRESDKFTRIPIELKRLDEIELPAPVSLIKIDTEGYEAAFLRGAGDTVARDRPVIFGEFASGWLKRRGEDLRATLLELDYDVASLTQVRSAFWSPDSVLAHDVDLTGKGPLPQNLLLTPRPA